MKATLIVNKETTTRVVHLDMQDLPIRWAPPWVRGQRVVTAAKVQFEMTHDLVGHRVEHHAHVLVYQHNLLKSGELGAGIGWVPMDSWDPSENELRQSIVDAAQEVLPGSPVAVD